MYIYAKPAYNIIKELGGWDEYTKSIHDYLCMYCHMLVD